MAPSTSDVTIPEVRVDLESLLETIRRLEPDARRRVARVLVESDMDERLGSLIHQLAAKPPVGELSDTDVDDEIKAVREAGQRSR